MAIDTITEKFGGESSGSSEDGQKFTQRKVRKLLVVSNDPNDTEDLIRYDPLVPQLRSQYFGNPFLRASDVSVTKTSPILYEVTITYSASTKGDRSPLDEPPKIKWYPVEWEDEIDRDINGKIIATVNQERYSPNPREVFVDQGMTIERNIADFDIATYGPLNKKTNSGSFFGRPAKTVCCTGLQAESVIDDDYSYYAVTANVVFRFARLGIADANLWKKRVFHQGFLIRDDAAHSPLFWHRALDGHGKPVVKEVPLKTDGTRATAEADHNWQYWETIESISFAPILALIN